MDKISSASPAAALAPSAPAAARIRTLNMLPVLVGHCAGMLDLVGLPVWVGACLVGWFHLDPQQAGLLATLFLGGEVVASVLLAPRFGRVPARSLAVAGYTLAAASFLAMATAGTSCPALAVLHLVGGIGAGCALTMVHGTMGRSSNPHRMFAYAGLTLGCFAIAVLGSGPALIAAHGGQGLFAVFGGIMAAAALLCVILFPAAPATAATRPADKQPMSPRIWYGMAGMGIFCLAQSMIFPFVERIGIDRGYAPALVAAVLIAIGFSNLVPAPLAALLERRLRGETAILAGIGIHALIILAVTQLADRHVYAAGVAVIATPLLFVHTFLFGLLARLDPSGRATAATPAMVMIGSTIGPVLGGTLVMAVGYRGLGIGVVLFGLAAAVCFVRMAGGASR